jgi:predicted homoserine dehydrogenase-like protein
MLGPGPCWALYRPYHLTSRETPVALARAVLNGETTLATASPPVDETGTCAQHNLAAGGSSLGRASGRPAPAGARRCRPGSA